MLAAPPHAVITLNFTFFFNLPDWKIYDRSFQAFLIASLRWIYTYVADIAIPAIRSVVRTE